MERLNLRLNKELVKQIEDYALTNTNGNISEAARKLLEVGLEPQNTYDATQEIVATVMDEYLERITKVCSRGTKASLANLALLSHLTPAFAMFSNLATEMLLEHAENPAVDYEQLSIDALFDLQQFRETTAASVFNWAWAVGGRLQTGKKRESDTGLPQKPGTPDLQACTKNLKPHKYSETGSPYV